jgi:hypothetical protein
MIELDLRWRFGIYVLAIRDLVSKRFVFLPPLDFVNKPRDITVRIGRRGPCISRKGEELS